jgi:hypothetical protein
MATKNKNTGFDDFDYPIIYEREWFNMFNELEDAVRKAAIVIIAAMLVGALSLFFQIVDYLWQ